MATTTPSTPAATDAPPADGAPLTRRPSWAPVTTALTRIKSISLPKSIPKPSFSKRPAPPNGGPATPGLASESLKPEKPPKAPPQKRSDKRAERAALALRSWTFEIGTPPVTTSISKALNQLKSDLLNPIVGNKIILQLKTLSALYGPSASEPPATPAKAPLPHFPHIAGPIHAVCLDCTDAEANEKIFSRLPRSSRLKVVPNQTSSTVPSMQNADLNSVVSVLNEVRLVNLIEKPDPRFQALSASAADNVPSSSKDGGSATDGLLHMGEQLMALGFATSYAVFPDHKGLYPPTDRMSIITYWWGFELVIPPPSIKNLSEAVSISHAILNFLTAVSLVNSGVREIQPFIRYVAQYIDFQWASIKDKDKGDGVVCAAVWILPLALVSRAWDFAPRPPPKDEPKKRPGGGKKREGKKEEEKKAEEKEEEEKKEEGEGEKEEVDPKPEDEGKIEEGTIISEPIPPPTVEKV